MAIKKYKPTTPGRRGMSSLSFEEITSTSPERSLLEPLSKKGGRNNTGRITTRHQGGGHKRQYRVCLLYTSCSSCFAFLRISATWHGSRSLWTGSFVGSV